MGNRRIWNANGSIAPVQAYLNQEKNLLADLVAQPLDYALNDDHLYSGDVSAYRGALLTRDDAIDNGSSLESGAPDKSEPVPVGGEFRVNSLISGNQFTSSVAALDGGGFVITWTSDGQDGSSYGIYGQRYDAAGVAQGSEFRINTVTSSVQKSSSVAALDGGGFVVTWASFVQDGSGYGIYGQRYDSAGVAQGSEFRINTFTLYDQDQPSVAALVGGGFVVTWSSNNQDSFQFGVYGQRFNAAGVAQGSEFRINTYTFDNQIEAFVAALEGGGFVVTWSSQTQDGSGYGIYGQRYDSAGVAQGSEFRINSYTDSTQANSSVAALDGGGFVVTWASFVQDGSGYGIYGQRYDSAGVAQGSEFRINTFTNGNQLNSSVAALDGGGFVVTWTSSGQDGSAEGIYGQRYDAAGIADGAEFRLNETTAGSQMQDLSPRQGVTQLADGSLIATWQGNGIGDSIGVFARRFAIQSNTAPVGNADSYGLFEDDTPTFSTILGVLANDTDPENDMLTATLITGPTNGTLVLNPNGSFTYSPNANFNGTDSFTYSASDGSASTGPVTVTLTVISVNDAPFGADGSINFYEDNLLILNDPLYFGFGDSDGNSFAGVWIDSYTGNGSFTLNGGALTTPTFVSAEQIASGQLVFTPAPNANGNNYAEFSYRVVDDGGSLDGGSDTGAPNTRVINVLAQNDAPVGVADAYTIDEDGVLTVGLATGVLANDTDADGNALTATLASNVAHGTLVLNADGSFTYTPNANYNGTDSFTYYASDGSAQSAPVTVTLSIDPVNDAPTISNLQGDLATFTEDVNTSSFIDVGLDSIITDSDSTNFNGGSLSVSISSGFVAGRDRVGIFQDGVVSTSGGNVTVNGVLIGTVTGNNITGQPTMVLTFTTDNATLANVQEVLRHVFFGNGFQNPVAGTRGITVTLTDGDGTANGGGDTSVYTTSVNVIAANDAPIGIADAYTIGEDGVLTVGLATGVLANDTDLDSSSLTASLVTGPAHGSLTLNTDGSFTYAPTANYFGSDSFTYRASDGSAQSSPVTVTLTVNPVNDAPTVSIIAANGFSGMGLAAEWTDYENQSGEMPQFVWGASNGGGANRIGLTVTFANGLTGSITYNNVAGLWNSFFSGRSAESATGFFTAAQGLHILYANGTVLPMAWENFSMAYSGNFDLDYFSGNSTFRADVPGWQSAVFRTYTSAITPSATEQVAFDLKNWVTVSDVDAGTGTMSATLSVTYGILNISAGTSGASIVSGNGTASVVVSGTLAQINALLSADATSVVSYLANTDSPPASTTLSVTVDDNGNTGTGGALTGAASVVIPITAVNDAPVVDLNGANAGIDNSVAYTEGSGRVMLAPDVAVGDVDSATLTGATVTIANGFDSADSLRITVGASGIIANYNSSTGVLTLSGAASASVYQSVLATLSFKSGSENPAGTRDIIVTVTDGSATSVAAHITIAVTPVNDAPVNFVPGAQSGTSGSPIIFSTGNGNALSVTDPDAGSSVIKVKIYVDHGILTLSGTSGLTLRGNGSSVISMQGSMADINAALNGLSYQPTAGYTGADTLTIFTDDKGNSGSGGALFDTDTVAITINPGVPTALPAPQIDLLDDGAGSNIAGAFIGKEHVEGPGGHLNIANHAFQTGPDLGTATEFLG